MLPTELFSDRKVVLFLTRDGRLANAVANLGAAEVVAFSPSAVPGDGRYPYRGEKDVGRNNADIVLLEGRSVLAARSKDLKHLGGARFVLVRATASAMLAAPFLLNHLRRRRLAWRGPLAIPIADGAMSKWLVFENVARKPRTARYYASMGESIEAMFASIADLRYSVLRSKDKLQNPTGPGDLDILVHNDDATELVRRLTSRFGTMPVDIYTPFSVPGHSDGNVAYLPPARALDLIARRMTGSRGAFQPSAKDALLSYCYHLLFHRQAKALGEGERLLPATWDDEDRFAELGRLCDAVGVKRLGSLPEMEELLKREGWFPESETINFVARTNKFVRDRYAVRSSYPPGLAVFILREAAVRYELVETIEAMLAAEGFEIRLSAPVPAERSADIAAHFRGGNWTSPKDREPGGVPAHFIIAFDPAPIAMPANVEIERMFVDNQRLDVKRKIRKKTAEVANRKHLNSLHSSDNSLQALEYIRMLCPQRHDEFEALVRNPNLPSRSAAL